nr:MAG TPA: defensin [Caudoviricetes sp.]
MSTTKKKFHHSGGRCCVRCLPRQQPAALADGV